MTDDEILEETSEETSEDISEGTLQEINNHISDIHGLVFVGVGFIVFFFIAWLALKIEKMLETYFQGRG